MSGYTAAVLLGSIGLSLRGLPGAATAVCLAIAAYAVLLDLSYLVRKRRRSMLVLPHRRYLDRIVRAQWLTIGVAGTLVAQSLDAAGLHPWDEAGPIVQAVIVGWTVMWSVIYASSLVDWYWILPRVSGIVAPPPCTVVGGKTFDRMTGVWLFHRGAATALVTFTLAGVPAWIAGTIDDGSGRALLTILGVALAIGFNAVNAGTVWALKQFNHPVVVVGWYLRLRKHVDDPAPQDAYVLDVAVSGVKYKLESEVNGRFLHDGQVLPFALADPATRSDREVPICPSLRECRAANWYCLRNRNANSELAPDDRDPAPLPETAPTR